MELNQTVPLKNEESRGVKSRVMWLIGAIAVVGLVAVTARSTLKQNMMSQTVTNHVAVQGTEEQSTAPDTRRGFANTCSRREVVRVLDSYFKKLRLRSRAVNEQYGARLDRQMSALVARQVRILDLSDKAVFGEAGRYYGIRGMKLWLERGERPNVRYSPRSRKFYWAPFRKEIGSFAFRDYRYVRYGRRFRRRGLEGGSITAVVARRVARGPRRGRCLITELSVTRFMARSLWLPRETDMEVAEYEQKMGAKAEKCVKSMAVDPSDFWKSITLVKEDTTVHFVGDDGSLGEATGSSDIAKLASGSTSAAKKLRSLHSLAGKEKSVGMGVDKERNVVVMKDNDNNVVEIDPQNCELMNVYLSDNDKKPHPLAKEAQTTLTLTTVLPVCVDANSMIETDESGSTRVASSIKIGDTVMSRRGPTKVVYIVRGESDVMEVALANGKSIRATGTHLVVTNDGLKRMDRVRVGDLVASTGGKYVSVTSIDEKLTDAVKRPVLSLVTTEGEFVLGGGAVVSSYSHDALYARWVHAVSLPLRLMTLAADKVFGPAAADKCANWIVDSFGVALTPTPQLLSLIGVRS